MPEDEGQSGPDSAEMPPAPPPTTPALSDTRHNAVEAVTWPVRVAAAWGWRLVIIGGAVYLLAMALGHVGIVVFAFIIALFLTAILHPLEARMRALPGRRSLHSLLALLVGIIAVAGLGWFVAWQVSNHSQELGDQLTRVVNNTKHWLETGPLHVKSSDLDQVSSKLSDTIQKHSSELLSGAVTTVKAVSEFLAAVLLILLTTFYLLRDGEIVWSWFVGLFPKAARPRLDFAGRAGWVTFGGYMRGQLLIALFHGTTTTILLFILDVPLAAALGVLIFIGSFIPLLGLTITGALAVAIALLEHGATAAIIVAVAIVVLVQVEGHVLQPFIMSRSVKVHPLAIVLAVIAGTTLKGIPGALIAVPLVAFVNTAVKALQHGPGDAHDTMKQQVSEELDEQQLESDNKERKARHSAQ
ncbi:MAG: putative PurR-regulated permease PerM [Mycobacterium sp.]|nr:putative PurR-regulated permease PerM [Mycobacterium sp.]